MNADMSSVVGRRFLQRISINSFSRQTVTIRFPDQGIPVVLWGLLASDMFLLGTKVRIHAGKRNHERQSEYTNIHTKVQKNVQPVCSRLVAPCSSHNWKYLVTCSSEWVRSKIPSLRTRLKMTNNDKWQIRNGVNVNSNDVMQFVWCMPAYDYDYDQNSESNLLYYYTTPRKALMLLLRPCLDVPTAVGLYQWSPLQINHVTQYDESIDNMVNNMVRPVVSSFNNVLKTRREYK
jgi:hypothetical protein